MNRLHPGWGIMTQERSCKAGAGLSILIQHLKIGSPTRFGAGEQASGGFAAREKPEGARGAPTSFNNVGQCRGSVRPSGALLYLLIANVIFRQQAPYFR